MLFLIVAAAAVPLLYVWLIGHWFARVLVFLVLAVLFGIIGSSMTHAVPKAEYDPLGLIIGFALAWVVSGIPLYWRRHKARSTSMEIALR